jgi:hypothetical protein
MESKIDQYFICALGIHNSPQYLMITWRTI